MARPPRVPASSLHVSVSHAGLLVAVAIAVGSPVGIDVERIRDSRATVRVVDTEEARFKAGGGPRLVVHVLPEPWPGHVMAIAHERGATVETSTSNTEYLKPR